MIIVIDGYNMLKSRNNDNYIDDRTRHDFLDMLARYSKHKKHKIVVIFDGGPYDWPHKEQQQDIKIIFSGRKESADEIIMQYLQDRVTRDILLVTSDHELNVFAAKQNIVSIDSCAFYSLVLQSKKKVKESKQDVDSVLFDESEMSLDIIMEQAAREIPCKQDDIPKRELPISLGRHSKRDRILLKKLKKL